ncbi:MAG: DUF3368 domain-containing protein [Betaproteobacteria bacterium]|nr:DUF3368 domain-containing protein [Betaproteobacteria bacterium]
MALAGAGARRGHRLCARRALIGILIKARRQGFPVNMDDAIQRMGERGIWLSAALIDAALADSNES